MSDDLSKMQRVERILLDDDPTDISSAIVNYRAVMDSIKQSENVKINTLSVVRTPLSEPTGANKTLDGETTPLCHLQEIKELRNVIGDMSTEIDRLNSKIESSPNSTSIPQKQATGTVNRILVVMNGGEKLKYPLFKNSMTIGRSSENDIQLATEYVSRIHARITNKDSGAFIEDLNSRNGVVVNSKKVGLIKLSNGDMVSIGKMQFKFIDLMQADSVEGQA